MRKVLDEMRYNALMEADDTKEGIRIYFKAVISLCAELGKRGCPIKEYITNEELAGLVDDLKKIEDPRDLIKKKTDSTP